jgi:hypothetical protein
MRRSLSWALLVGVIMSCGEERVTEEPVYDIAPVLTEQVWGELSSRRVFFGHQSVGANILEGVSDLLTDASADFRVVSAVDSHAGSAPGELIEARIGENGDPVSKLRDFREILDSGVGQSVDVALMKFCYLDFGPQTDVTEVFESYRQEIRRLRERFPDLTLVHVTAPLTTGEPAARYWLKRALGKPTQRGVNAKRSQFNELLRSEYAGTAPVFDLARIESTRADGSRFYHRVGGDSVYALAPDWTDDGGHLNQMGRRLAAAQLLSVIAAATESRPVR